MLSTAVPQRGCRHLLRLNSEVALLLFSTNTQYSISASPAPLGAEDGHRTVYRCCLGKPLGETGVYNAEKPIPHFNRLATKF